MLLRCTAGTVTALLLIISFLDNGLSFVPMVYPPQLHFNTGENGSLMCIVPSYVEEMDIIWIRLLPENFNGPSSCSNGSRNINSSYSGSASGSTSGSGSSNSSDNGSASGSTSGSGSDSGSDSASESTLEQDEAFLESIAIGRYFNLTVGDVGGYYVCTVWINGRNCSSNYSTVTVAPSAILTLANQTIERGDTAVLTCNSMGGPGNDFGWLFNKKQLNGSSISVNSASTLTLSDVNASTGGEYSCVVINRAGTDTASTFVFVSPYFVAQPVNTEGSNGSAINLTCQAEAFPEPDYQWQRVDGDEIKDSVIGLNSMSLIFNPLLFGDEGEYYCTATSRNISIKSNTAIITVSPEGSVSVNFTHRFNDTLRLTCSSEGGPRNEFSWFRMPSNDTIGEEQELEINISSVIDDEVYICVVSNAAGSSNDSIFINTSLDVKITPLMNLRLRLGTGFYLTCMASGFSTPRILWYHNGTQLNETERDNVEILSINDDTTYSVTSYLNVTMVMTRDSGMYNCMAVTGIPDHDAADSDAVTITIQDTPEKPQNVMAVNRTSRLITLTWEEPPENNAPIQSYEVTYMEPSFVEGDLMKEVNTTIEMANITDLFPGVNYTFTVIAYNEIGPSVPSDPLTVRTLDEAPASSPSNVNISNISSTEVLVMWDMVPLMNQNGIITMYEVMYQPLETFNGNISTQTMVVSRTEMSVFLIELQEFVNYNISVRAYTSVGAGPYSDEVTVMTLQDEPAAPPDNVRVMAVSSTIINVTWDMVPPIDQNGIITMYEVMYQPLETFNGNISTNTINLTNMSVLLTDLQEFVNYTISVRAYTSVGAGPYSDEVTVLTLEDEPSDSPQNVDASVLSSMVVMVTWEEVPEISQNGIIITYEILLQPTTGIAVMENSSELTINVTGLLENVLYNITVRAYTSVGSGIYSSPPVQVMTHEDIPGPVPQPPVVQNDTINSTSALITWNPPKDPNGIIRNYTVNLMALSSDAGNSQGRGRRKRLSSAVIIECITGSNVEQNITVGGDKTSLRLNNLTPYTVYEYRVLAITTVGPGNFSSPREFRTIEGEPSSVMNLNAISSSSTSITVTWNEPQCPYGVIDRYIVFYRQTNSLQPMNNMIISNDNYTSISVSITKLTIKNLLPFKNYSIHVQAVVVPSTGIRAVLFGQIELEVLAQTLSAPDTDIPTPPTTSIDSPTSKEVVYLIGDPTEIDTGRVILCAVVVVRGRISDDQKSNYNAAQPYSDETSSYITAAWDEEDVYAHRVPSKITVGDGTTYMVNVFGEQIAIYNAPLKSNTEYSIFTRYDIANELNPGEPHRVYSDLVSYRTIKVSSTSSPVGVIVAVLFLVFLIIAIVIVLIVILYLKFGKRDYSSKLKSSTAGNVELTRLSYIKIIRSNGGRESPLVHKPVSIDVFEEYVSQHHHDDDILFLNEYENEVEPVHSPISNVAAKPNNFQKNRYVNIKPYDHSRVVLEVIPDEPDSDYINANFIDGYEKKNCFIAAQGPVPASVSDFWRMIWEQKVDYVVMVTNCEEKGKMKCHKYWPDEIGKCLHQDSFQIEVQESLILASYTVRTFSLQRKGCKTERIIRQFHFTVWPDHGVPEYPSQLLYFVRQVMQENPLKNGPMVVHCSAGVGRTGTFITLFTQLQRIQAEGNVDIFGFVRSMRHNRCLMVQTKDQYIFIHDALLEAIECGITEVAARDFPLLFRKLTKEESNENLETEFHKLTSTIHNKISTTTSLIPGNRSKNRYNDPTLMPYDKNRVILAPTGNFSNYINASYIDGYHKPYIYIATQGPLPDTVNDFWRMVWEQKCSSIVMLTRENEGGRVRCHKYWPEKGANNYSTLQVIHHSEVEYPDYIMRDLKLVDIKDGSSHQVKQYQYIGWPEDTDSVPENCLGLIDLIGQVLKWQQTLGTNPIVVHCSDGCGRTGTFIAVSILLERLKTEGVVDVFHTVRSLRLQRQEVVATLEQYKFCYKTVMEFLDSFELYSNFK